MFSKLIKSIGLLIFVLTTSHAGAGLSRVGPVDPANGYPAWYQDSTGLALGLCIPNAAELLTGSCLILTSGLPNPALPDRFPDNFPDEHFWFNANTTLTTATGRAVLVLGLEAAFTGPVVPGGQISFGRVRVVIDVPPPGGTYTVTHPYGVEIFPDVAPGPRAITFTEDVGIGCGGFACALDSRVGPFLRAAAGPGGAALPPVVLSGGNSYLSDPSVPTFVTGSPFNTNLFRIEGPGIGGPGVNMIETSQFNLQGRVYLAPIPSLATIERATYSRDGASAQIEVFASAAPAIGAATPKLSFAAPNVSATQMAGNSSGRFYGQLLTSAPATVPASVIVTNNADVPPSSHEANLIDEVRVTQADFDPNTQTLMIAASSSDMLTPPTLIAEGFGTLVNGSLVANGVTVPPATVKVLSSAGGNGTFLVKTSRAAAQPSGIAVNDAAITLENQPVTIDVLANDSGIAAATLQILGAPGNGSTSINLTTGLVTYTPKLNFFGNDSFTYTAKGLDGLDSNVATVAVRVDPVAMPPVANPDSVTTSVVIPVVINVLTNDISINGTLVPGSVAIVTAPAAGSATVNLATGAINYTPAAVGTFTFTYTVKDSLGTAASPATVTVNVTPDSGIVNVTKAVASTSLRNGVRLTKWVVAGTSTAPTPAQTITVSVHIGPTLNGTFLGQATVDTLGDWRLTVLDSPLAPDSTRTISVKSSIGPTRLAVPLK